MTPTRDRHRHARFAGTLLVLAWLALPSSSFATELRIAALDVFDHDDCLTGADRHALGNAVRAHLREDLPVGRYFVYTRHNIFEAAGSNLPAGPCEEACAVATGRALDADFVLTTTLSPRSNRTRVTIALYETQTGNLLRSRSAWGRTYDSLEDATLRSTSRVVSTLPQAEHSSGRLRAEAERIHQEQRKRRRLVDRVLSVAALGTVGAATHFHLRADGDDDTSITWRNVSASLAAGLALWRVVRSFGDVASVDEIAADLAMLERSAASPVPIIALSRRF